MGGWPRRTTDQKERRNEFLSTFFFSFLFFSWAIFPPSAVESESKEGKTGKRIDNTKRRTKNEKVRFGQRFERLSHSWNFEDLHTVLSLFAVILTCRFHGLWREYSFLCKSMLCILFFFSRLSERRGRKGGRGSWVRRGHHQGMELSVEISSILSFSILSHKMYHFLY